MREHPLDLQRPLYFSDDSARIGGEDHSVKMIGKFTANKRRSAAIVAVRLDLGAIGLHWIQDVQRILQGCGANIGGQFEIRFEQLPKMQR
jgi:uncharacterized NAD-dependent epimerase/dehydratase family protein